MNLLLDSLLNAVVLAAIYALLAVSMTFIYRVTNIFQLALGDVLVVGGYTGYLTSHLVPNLLVVTAAAAAAGGALGVLTYDGIFRHLRLSGHLFPLVAAIALAGVLEEGMRALFLQGNVVSYPDSMVGNRAYETGFRLALLGIAAALGLAFHLLLTRTQYGRGLRAVADNPFQAELLGISSQASMRGSFALGSLLAGAAGSLMAVVFGYLTPYNGGSLTGAAIAIVLAGGLGSITGAVAGSVVIAVAQTFVTVYVSSTYRDGIAFALIALIVMFRPQGLFGTNRMERA